MKGDGRQDVSSENIHESDSLPTSESQGPVVECMEVDIDPPPLNVETPDAASHPESIPSTSAYGGPSTRSSTEKVTPRKHQKFKKGRFNVSTSKAAEVVKFRSQISALISKLKVPKHIINQEIKRKQNTIVIKDRQTKDLQAKVTRHYAGTRAHTDKSKTYSAETDTQPVN